MINMKKLVSLLLAITVIFSLAACSGGPPSSSDNGSSESAIDSSESTSQSSEAPAESEGSADSEEPTVETGGTLIAYFSWSGNTEKMAQLIQVETNGNLFRIEPATPYTDDYNELLDIAQQEQADNARPEQATRVENWDSYEVVFVGYPTGGVMHLC